ncbi:MacB family efflux pump subunit [Desulfovibrio gilichinskyi]|uniref:Pyoverdine export ATP-binding/permease protein PvdT n=1 Tax=Desulfovibrio gilichinskyi TaxID=1519643 RepID=A0A1X7EKK9_9BACT|nr:MacB family efflux pump subunit [Desulfovibrio gilichinskyi]SMF35160.1 macrolide transport system ATP-binding/permease protein [Desulfovibrio gilichinskyi]
MPLLQIKNLRKEYPAGDQTMMVLKDVNISIEAGEMVAIVGASGSGKSTLMNIIGCLDQPTSGTYCISGRDVGELDANELAKLRREHFGFIFQRYHLLSSLTALENVEIPAIYAGMAQAARHERAAQLLARLGLEERVHYRPGQLSGGQQQRVSISRALMNGGQVILADEPTGALDSTSSKETMKLLTELNSEGHTLIVVTHDMEVAAYARRIIEIRDGEVVSDRLNTTDSGLVFKKSKTLSVKRAKVAWLDQSMELLRMALSSMMAHKLRTFLTMLGIIIGIASVVSVVALGKGSEQSVLKNISSIGTNVIDIFPGADFGDRRAGNVHTLIPADASALSQQPYVDSVTPKLSTTLELRYRNIDVSASVSGVGDQYFRVYGYEIAEGSAFNKDMVTSIKQVAVIDQNTRKRLFGTDKDVLGKVIILGSVPCRIIGVTKKKQSFFGNSDSLNIWVPYTTAMHRIIGQAYLANITVRVKDGMPMQAAEKGIQKMLVRRHNLKDFFIMNTDTIRKTIESTTQTMTLLISAIAIISLVVGGIGVMNIMLVSVTERTGEIGVRMAVGARCSDIMIQFLIEAVLVCLLGGIFGIVLSLIVGVIFSYSGSSYTMVYSSTSMILAFVCSTIIGVVFGYLPARSAASLNPVDALVRE